MITSLTYVSKSCLARSAAALEIDDIVERSSQRNEQLAIRGALVFTERHFAQVLEGPKASVATLMDSIRRDNRHKDVTVICEVEIDDYRFPNWTLAYNGGASYMDHQVASLLRPHDEDYDDEALRLYLLVRRLALESLDSGTIGRPSVR